MSNATIVVIILGSFGALILGMAGLIKAMVVGRLDGIQASIAALTRDSKDHGEQLVRHETILEMHGLTERRAPSRIHPTEGE